MATSPMDLDYAKRSFRDKQLSAFVIGHTGAIGKILVEQLVRESIFKRIVLIGRREIAIKEGDMYKCIEQRVVNFDNIEEYPEAFQGCDVGFCCLGTTRKQSGREGFIKVDHDYCLNAARVAKQQGCKQFHLISTSKADPNSSFLYTRVKGETESDLKSLNFDHLIIYRPGFLIKVDRGGNFRFGEWLFTCCCCPIICCFPALLTMPGSILVAAMINKTVLEVSQEDRGNKNWECLENGTIHRLGNMD